MNVALSGQTITRKKVMRIISSVVIAVCTAMVVGCGSSDDDSGLPTTDGEGGIISSDESITDTDASGDSATPADETAPVSDPDAEDGGDTNEGETDAGDDVAVSDDDDIGGSTTVFAGAIVGRWQFCLADPVGLDLGDGGAAFSFEFEFAADGRYVRYSNRHALPECDGDIVGEGIDIELEATYTVGGTLTTSEGLSAQEVVFTAEGVSEVTFLTIDGDTLIASDETEDGLITEMGERFTRQNGFLVLQ